MNSLFFSNLLELGIVKKGDLVGITAGLPFHQSGTTNMITVKTVG